MFVIEMTQNGETSTHSYKSTKKECLDDLQITLDSFHENDTLTWTKSKNKVTAVKYLPYGQEKTVYKIIKVN